MLVSSFTLLSAPITIKKKKAIQQVPWGSLAWFCEPSKRCISHELVGEEGFPPCLIAIYELENQQVAWPWTNKQTNKQHKRD